MRELIEEILKRLGAGETLGVCLVSKTRGSTPQKAGAMMLVLQNGQTLGTLGGGCVEAEVRVRAMQLIQNRQDRLLRFSLDHDYGWDDGLVCGGVMDIAVKTSNEVSMWRDALNSLTDGRAAALNFDVINERDETVRVDHTISPRPTLIIAGAGHVGTALAKIVAAEFRTMIIDDRADLMSRDRFDSPCELIVGDIENELKKIELHEHSYVVIVTRGHKHDAAALGAVIESGAKYVGLIGSRRKVVTILKSLRDRGISSEKLREVHSPIGLNIGAITPTEIAISIAAELTAVRRGVNQSIESMRLSETQFDRLFNLATDGAQMNTDKK